ncbi:MAG: protein kinase [Micrococcaceae bacterium]
MDSTISVLKPGSTLDSRYKIKSLIAKGGMATVYLAYDQKLGRDVALKVMFPHLLDDKKFVHRFIQEARNAAVLNDPHVVRTLDQGRTGPFMYLVMEYLDGYTLRDILYQENHLTPRQTLEALEPILSGVAAAHRAKIIHRDLKPENVLIAEDGRIKIADFGLARMMDNNTVTGSLLGTVAYMAPELVTEGEATEASDVYSLGVMAYEMLTGQQPHQGDSPMQVAYAQVNDRIPVPSLKAPGLAPEIDEFVLHCTEPNADKRPPDAAVMLAETERLLRILPDEALDYDFEAPTQQHATTPLNTENIKYRPTAQYVPPTKDEETELIPDFIKEHNQTLAQSRRHAALNRENFPSTQSYNHSSSLLGQGSFTTHSLDTATLQQTQVSQPDTAIQPLYPQPTTSSISAFETPQSVTAADLNLSQNIKHKRHVKKAEKKNLKELKKSYRVQLRPGNAAVRSLIGTTVVTGITAAAGYAGWYYSEGPYTNTAIPNVVNNHIDQGKQTLQSAGFKPEIVEENSSSIPDGTIIRTVPDATGFGNRNSKVQVYVAQNQNSSTPTSSS